MKFLIAALVAVSAMSQQAAGDWTVCYTQLGCISANASWFNLLYRPINLMPLSRSVINTTFTLRTRELPTTNVYLNASIPSSISSSRFKASRPTKFLVHGFLNNGTEHWFTDMAANLLTYGDYNVIIVGWGGGSSPPYAQATANTRLVGLEVAFMVNTLMSNFSVPASNVHLIGHSLGAHICGYAGQNIANLGRITGLDPASPYFQWMPAFVRLDPTDAKFVDNIHTNGVASILELGFGMIQPNGHLDFYPNGGQNQPGCSLASLSVVNITQDLVNSLINLGDCSHMRAITFFSDSLVSGNCQPVGYECASYAAFQAGQCASCGSSNTNCSRFGIAADTYPTRSRTNVQLYLNTNSTSPYCEYHYRVSINTAKPTGASSWLNGAVTLSMYGTNGTVLNKVLTPSGGGKLTLGQSQLFLDVENVNIGKVQKVVLQWAYIYNPLNPLTFCGPLCNSKLYVSSVQIIEMNNYPQTAITANTFKQCLSGTSYATIASGSSATFSTSC